MAKFIFSYWMSWPFHWDNSICDNLIYAYELFLVFVKSCKETNIYKHALRVSTIPISPESYAIAILSDLPLTTNCCKSLASANCFPFCRLCFCSANPKGLFGGEKLVCSRHCLVNDFHSRLMLLYWMLSQEAIETESWLTLTITNGFFSAEFTNYFICKSIF